MNEIQEFDFNGNNVRAVTINDEPFLSART